jgi:hypothetical protein
VSHLMTRMPRVPRDIAAGQKSFMERNVSLGEELEVSFQWKVESDPTDQQVFIITDDQGAEVHRQSLTGDSVNNLDANAQGWVKASVLLGAGDYTLRWEYDRTAQTADPTNTKHGAWIDSLKIQSAPSDGTLQFQGQGYATTNLKPDTTYKTFAYWVKYDRLDAWQRMGSRDAANSNQLVLGIEPNLSNGNNVLYLAYGQAWGRLPNSGINQTDTWYHLAFSKEDDGWFRIYVNGQLAAETNNPVFTMTGVSDQNIYLGAYNSGGATLSRMFWRSE